MRVSLILWHMCIHYAFRVRTIFCVQRTKRKLKETSCMISSFRRGVNEIFALLGCYAALIGIYRPIGCPETSATNYQLMLRNITEQRRAQTLRLERLTLYLLTWRIWWAPNNASIGQMGFNSAFKGLILSRLVKKFHVLYEVSKSTILSGARWIHPYPHTLLL